MFTMCVNLPNNYGPKEVALTGFVVGSFLPTTAWLGDEPQFICCVFPGVRRPCVRNVEKKFLDGVVVIVTVR